MLLLYSKGLHDFVVQTPV